MSANYFVIEKIVLEWVDSKKSFTAHDVTQEVRSRGHKIIHDEVRTEVHNLFDRGSMTTSYKRTVVSLADRTSSNPSYVNPYLYHDASVDPYLYRNSTAPSSTVAAPVSTVVKPDPNLVDQTIIQIPNFDD